MDVSVVTGRKESGLTGVGRRQRRVDGVGAHAVGGRGRALALGDGRRQPQRQPRARAERRAAQVGAAQRLAGHAILRQELV